MALSKKEFAKVLGVSSGTIDNLRRKNTIYGSILLCIIFH